MLTMGQALCFKNEIKDDIISTFISMPHLVANPTRQVFESIMSYETQETIRLEAEGEDIFVTTLSDSILVEIEPGKTLNINLNLSLAQTEQHLKIL